MLNANKNVARFEYKSITSLRKTYRKDTTKIRTE